MGADEDRAGVGDPGGDVLGVGRLDLEVLGAIGVHDGEALVEVRDHHDTALLPAQRLVDALAVQSRRDLCGELGLDRRGELRGVGDQHARGQGIVLGLGDQVRGDVGGMGGAVGEDRDLGGPGLRVDAHRAAHQALGGGHVDVARPGDQVHALQARTVAEVVGAVGQQRDRLGTTGGEHLGDPQQGTGGEDRGVGQAAELLLRRGGEHDLLDTRDLGRDHVHHHRAGQHSAAAGDVEPHPAYGHPALGDRAAGHHLHGVRGTHLGGVDPAHPLGRLLERGADRGIELVERALHRGLRDPQLLGPDPVEALGRLAHGLRPAGGDVLDHGPHGGGRGLDVQLGARQGGRELGGAEGPRTQVGHGEEGGGIRHGGSL